MAVQVKAFQTYNTGYPDKHLIMNNDQFQTMMNFLEPSTLLIFDFETSGLAWFKHAEACGIGLGSWDNAGQLHNFYVPFRHQTGEAQLDINIIGPAFKKLLENPNTLKVAHNIKFDEHIARKEGWQVKGTRYDTMIAARLYDENRRMGLKQRAKEDLGRHDADEWNTKVESEIKRLAKESKMYIKEYRNKHGYSQVDITLCGTYACFDVEFTGRLHSVYEAYGISSRYPRIWNTEMELTEVLCDMEETGMLIDVGYLETLRDALGGVRESLKQDVEHQLGGYSFNFASDAQLRDFMTGRLGLRLTKMTKGQKYSVDKEVLAEFAPVHPVLQTILEWREADKIYSTYTNSILERLDDKGLVHTDFQQAGTNSGRLSAKAPNLQNQKSDSDERAKKHTGKSLEDGGKDPWSIKKAYVVPREGWVRLYFDYSQVELRILGFYSKDPVLVQAYLAGEDLHDRTSLEVFGTKEKAKRRLSKIINFGLCCKEGQRVLTKQDGLVPIEKIRGWHEVWDGVEWVSHGGLVCNGEQEVITYDGVSATPDHIVYLEGGGHVEIGKIASSLHPRRLAVGAVGEVPVRYTEADGENKDKKMVAERWKEGKICKNGRAYLQYLWEKSVGVCRQYKRKAHNQMPLPPKIWRSQGKDFRSAVRCYGAALREGYARFLTSIQRAWYQSTFQIERTFYSLGAGNLSRFGFQKVDFRQDRQRWTLQPGKPAFGKLFRKQSEQRAHCADYVQAWAPFRGRQSVSTSHGAAGLPDMYAGTQQSVLGATEGKKAKVYDLLNAGPRHRFTIEGKIVSNSYGLTDVGFSRQAKISITEATKHMKTFFERYAGVASFRTNFWNEVGEAKGFFQNLFGRPRKVVGINSTDKYLKGRAERQAIATLIQGTAAELMKESLVRISKFLKEEKLEAKLVCTIHDEAQIDCPIDEMAIVTKGVKKLMENFPEFAPIPIIADGEYSTTNWADKKALPGS